MRAQAQADIHGEVDLHTVLVDELFTYGVSEGQRLVLTGPDVYLKPKAGQILALAMHELAVNAIEHGALGTSQGRVEIACFGNGEGETPSLRMEWREAGPTISRTLDRRGFGMDVLTRLLAYELQAEAQITFEPNGLTFTMHLPLPERVGRVVGQTGQP